MTCGRVGVVLVMLAGVGMAAAAEKPSPREGLQPLNDLIGTWRGTGTPEGTREEKQRGFWTESITCQWQFKGDDAWLTLTIDKGKYFTRGELRYLPEQAEYRLTLWTPEQEGRVFVGKREERRLTLSRDDEARGQTQQMVIRLLHPNRFVYTYEVKPRGKTFWTRQYQVGATKEGVPFASGDGRPECIVSGGLGTMPVTHKGKTYYVCCGGCRDAFHEDPEKYIKEFEEAQKKP